MKGIIFNLLEDFISEGWGDDVYEEILAMCPLKTKEPFIGPATYPDSDLLAIVDKVCEKLGVSVPQAVHAFGKYCLPHLIAKFPVFVQGHEHPKTFLKTIDNVIHVEVRKLFPDAKPPRVTWEDPALNRLVLTYVSERKLCALMTGLLEGVAEHFKTPIQYTHTKCMRNGADVCEFHLTFGATNKSAA